MKRPPKFTSYEDWARRHLKECPFVTRDSQRSDLSRMFLCSRSFVVVAHRCMWRLCPLRREER